MRKVDVQAAVTRRFAVEGLFENVPTVVNHVKGNVWKVAGTDSEGDYIARVEINEVNGVLVLGQTVRVDRPVAVENEYAVKLREFLNQHPEKPVFAGHEVDGRLHIHTGDCPDAPETALRESWDTPGEMATAWFEDTWFTGMEYGPTPAMVRSVSYHGCVNA